MLKTLLIITIAITILGCCVCPPAPATSPSEFFSESDRLAIISLLQSSKSGDGSFGTLEETFYAVNLSRSQQYPEAASLVDTSLTCQYAKQFLNNKQNVPNLFFAISIVETLKCGSTVGNDVANVLISGLKPSNKLVVQFLAVQAIARLNSAGHITFDESDFSSVVTNLANLQEPDGTFRSDPDVKGSNALNAGYAAHMLTHINAQDQEGADELAESIIEIFSPSGASEEEDDIVYFSGDSRLDDLKATALVLSGANALLQSGIGDRETIKSGITKEAIVGIAEFAVKNKRVSTLHDAFYLSMLLQSIASNPWHSPLVLSLTQGSLFATSRRTGGSGNEGFAKIRVTDIYGKYATPATVYIIRAYSVDDARDVVLTNQEAALSSEDNTTYSFNFLAKKPEPGYYTIEFTITPKGTSKFTAVKDVRNIKVVSAADVVDASIKVSNSKDPEDGFGASHSARYPEQVSQVISVSGLQYLTVSFKVKNQVSLKPVKVHQAFIRLRHGESGHTTVFNAKSSKPGQYSLTLDVASQSANLGHQSGKYLLELVVGDPFISNPLSWNLAELDIKLAAEKSSVARPSKGRLPTTLESKISGSNRDGRPDIAHAFRKADSRPPAIVSLVFSLIVLAPALLLVGGVYVVGGNLEHYPRDANSVMALGFHICLGLILGLFVVYWLALNIVQMLGYLFVLSFPTIFFGLKTLQAVHRNRTKSSN